ncbi:universal stress protein PHOS34 [Coffea arabica]|uniref:Universal stress protein PHOS34 n=1 Tax=Coffea arabica TaxID=13443 RepID=A0A6P6WLB7_COFAR|nr:universal stress protein PHOS34-like [Coffea arabica]
MAGGKQVMLLAIDDSEHSFYALKWTLEHFFTPTSNALFKLVIVHAKYPPTSVIGLAGPGSTDVLPLVEADLKRTAERLIEQAKELCKEKGVEDAEFEVIEGDARMVMCDAVDKHHASLLVLGSHGYGALKRVVLGSVSDHCSHHAHCSVMIVKQPKVHH